MSDMEKKEWRIGQIMKTSQEPSWQGKCTRTEESYFLANKPIFRLRSKALLTDKEGFLTNEVSFW